MRSVRALAAMLVVLLATSALFAQTGKTTEKTPYTEAYDQAHELLLRHEYFEAWASRCGSSMWST